MEQNLDLSVQLNDSREQQIFKKIPDDFATLLDPDEIKKGKVIIKQVKDKNQVLSELLEKLKKKRDYKIDVEEYDIIMPVLPPVHSPALTYTPEGADSQTLDIHPATVIPLLVAHLISFEIFADFDLNAIPDSVYQSFFETENQFMPINTIYRARSTLSNWLNNIADWYNDQWIELFPQGATTLKHRTLDFLFALAVLYDKTVSIYSGSGKKDLTRYWKMPIQERQTKVMKKVENPALRFVFKYKKRLIEDEDLIDVPAKKAAQPPVKVAIKLVNPPAKQPQLPVKVVAPIKLVPLQIKKPAPTTASIKDIDITYTYMLSMLLNEMKSIIVMTMLSQEVHQDLKQNERKQMWLTNARSVIESASRDLTRTNNNGVHDLYENVARLYLIFSQ